MINAKKLLEKLIIILFFIIPIIPALSNRAGIINPAAGMFVAGIKDIMCLLIIFTMLFFIKNRNSFQLKLESILIVVLFIYSIFHVFGYIGLNDIMYGFRHQIYYMLIGVLIWSFYIHELIPTEKIIKIMAWQFIMFTFLGLIEYIYPEVVTIIYGVSQRSDIVYAKLFTVDRLIGTFINPIIFGAFICSCFAAFYNVIFYSKIKYKWAIFWFLWSLGFFVVFFTLSRLVLITYITMTMIIIIRNLFHKEVITLCFVIVFLLFGVPYLLSILNSYEVVFERLQTLSSSSAFTENVRITNWARAIANLDSYLKLFWGLGLGSSLSELLVENSIVTILIELGIIGLFLYLSLNFVILFKLINLKRNNKIKMFLLLFFVAFHILSLGNDFSKVYPMSLYFWFILPLVNSSGVYND